MIKQGILNPAVNNALSKMTHLDTMLVSDAAMPLPKGVERVDLAFTLGTPPLVPVIEGILEECIIEKVYIANEIEKASPALLEEYRKLFGDIPIELIPHEKLCEMSENSRVCLRTGENRFHYSSVLLVCGCPY